MRWTMFLLAGALLTGGCDRGSPGNGQASAPATINEAQADAAIGNIVTTDNGEARAAATPGAIDRGHAGEPAPSVAFTGPDGQPVTLASFAGKPMLLNLWATWCAPCVKEMPALDRLAASGVTVVAVAQSDPKDKVVGFFTETGVRTLKPYLDPKLVLSTTYQAQLPTSILYDSRGREVWRVSGDRDWDSAGTKALVVEGK